MTRNEDSKLKCMCCESPKPGSEASKPAAKVAPSATFTFGSKPAPATDEGFKSLVAKQSAKWECSDCMTRNDDNKLKCMCCEKAKPGSDLTPAGASKILATSASFTFGVPPKVNAADEGFKKLVAQQTAKWECSSCMTRNESEKLKCLCCGEAKPGTIAENAKSALSTSSFSFGVPLAKSTTEAPKFSFGMPANPSSAAKTLDDTGFKKLVETQSAKWECTACLTRNDDKTSKCVCCEQPKPGSTPEDAKPFSFGSSKSGINLATSASFTFGVTSKAAVDQVDQAKPSFTFGSVNNVNTETATKLPALGTNIEKVNKI